MLIAVLKNKFIVLFITLFGTLSFPIMLLTEFETYSNYCCNWLIFGHTFSYLHLEDWTIVYYMYERESISVESNRSRYDPCDCTSVGRLFRYSAFRRLRNAIKCSHC